MSVLYVVVPLALAVVLVAAAAFVWAAKHGQFDDLDTPAVRMLHDDDEHRSSRPEPDGSREPSEIAAPRGGPRR